MLHQLHFLTVFILQFFGCILITDDPIDLEKVIRTRAAVLIGPWPDGLTMLVIASERSFNVSLGPTRDPDTRYYRSRVTAIVNDIKLECRLLKLRQRRGDASQ